MSLGVFIVGREAPRSRSHIQIPRGLPGQDSISREHLEITVVDEYHFFIVDLGSAHGTFLLVGQTWRAIKESMVDADWPIRLGEYQTTVRQLLTTSAPPVFEPSRSVAGTAMIRCTCGAAKERGKPCRRCGATG